MSNVGYATLSVVPSLKGAEAALAGQMRGPSAAAGTQAGGLFGGAFGGALGGVLAGGAAVAAIGAGLAAIGGSFDEAFDAIRVKTGATGAELEGLKDVFKNVVSDVPTDFGSAAEAIGGLQQRLHLSNGDLENVSERVLELSRITETDLTGNVDAVTRAFGDWGISTDDMGERLDQFFRASQLSGTSVADLAQNVTNFGSPLRQLGFSLDDSLAMFARFEAEGVNTSTVMSGMRQAVKNFSSGLAENETGVTNFQDVIAGVKDGTFDLTDAFSVFGARAAPDMFAAISEGRFDLADFTDTISNGSDTILGAADDTNDWRESLELLKNRALVLIEPLATRVFDALGQGAQVLLDLSTAISEGGLKGGLQFLSDLFAKIPTPIKLAAAALLAFISPIGALAAGLIYAYTHFEGFRNVVDAVASWLVGTAWPAIQDFARGVIEAFQSAVEWVQARWGAISEAVGHVMTVVGAILRGASAVITGIWRAIGDDVLNIVRSAWTLISGIIRGAMQVIQGIIDVVLGVINGDWQRVWNGIRTVVQGIWNAIKALIRAAWQNVRAILGAGLSALAALWRTAWSGIKAVLSAAWNAIKSAVRAGIDAVIGFFRSLPGRAVGALSAFAGMLGRAGSAALRGLFNGIKDVAGAVFDWFRELPGRVLDTLGDLGELLYEAGRAIINGLLDGIRAAMGAVTDFVGGIGSTIANLKGPLDYDRKLLIPAGEAIMEGLHKGLRDGFDSGPSGYLKGLTQDIGGGEFAFARNGAIRHRVVSSESYATRVIFEVDGMDQDLVRMVRKRVRIEGGDAQKVLSA